MMEDAGNLQATERLAAGSEYLVRFGSGEVGTLGASCCNSDCLVPSAIESDLLREKCVVFAGERGLHADRVSDALSAHITARLYP